MRLKEKFIEALSIIRIYPEVYSIPEQLVPSLGVWIEILKEKDKPEDIINTCVVIKDFICNASIDKDLKIVMEVETECLTISRHGGGIVF